MSGLPALVPYTRGTGYGKGHGHGGYYPTRYYTPPFTSIESETIRTASLCFDSLRRHAVMHRGVNQQH